MTPEKPVVLLHTDNYIRKGDWLKPRQHGRIQSLAAAELLRRGEVSYVVITGGVTTPNQPPVSDVMREQILRNLAHCPEYEERVISVGTARNTLDEVRRFKQTIQSHGWNNVLDIVPEGQLERVQRIAPGRLGKKVPIQTSEEILTERPKKSSFVLSLTQRAVATHRQSPEYDFYAKKNRKLGRIEALPGGVLFVALISKLIRNKASVESTPSRLFR